MSGNPSRDGLKSVCVNTKTVGTAQLCSASVSV
jgi:hypothetical protein